MYTEKAERLELWVFLPCPEDPRRASKMIAYSEQCQVYDLQRRRFNFGTKDQAWSLKSFVQQSFIKKYKKGTEKASDIDIRKGTESAPLGNPSVQFIRSVMTDSLRPQELQHARPPCLALTPGVHSNSHHWVNNAIQPSHPLSSPSPPAPNPSQNKRLFQWVSSLHEVVKVLEFQL